MDILALSHDGLIAEQSAANWRVAKYQHTLFVFLTVTVLCLIPGNVPSTR
jgi:hypothetical protein